MPDAVSDVAHGANERCPVVAGDGLGGLFATWSDDRFGDGVYALFGAVLSQESPGWTDSERVTGTEDGRLDGCPDMTIDSFGARHVVWQSFVDGDPEIFHSVRRPGDSGWSTPKRVNDERGPFAQWSPRIAADRAGNVHVVWVDYLAGTADVRHRRRNADGSWRASVRVNGESRGEQSEPALAETPHGEIVAVWRDSRNGANQIYGSRLPQYGDAWWPNAQLSVGAGVVDHRRPVVASDGRGGVQSMWIDVGTSPSSLRTAAMRLDDPEHPFWAPDRLAYQSDRGDVLDVAIAGGAGGQLLATWSESRPGTSRIYAAPLLSDAPLQPERVDEGRGAEAGRRPSIVVAPDATVHVVWEGTGRAGNRDVFHARANTERPAYSQVEVSGWLRYVGRTANCGGDAFVVSGCDGNVTKPVLARDIDLASWAGKYVIVRGDDVADTACRHISATEVVRELAPCGRATGVVTGRLFTLGEPLEGAEVRLGVHTARTGASGRFYVSDVPPGTYVVTATAPCAVTSVSAPVSVDTERAVEMPDGVLVRADATEDGVVDARDLVLVATALRSPAAHRPYCADVDQDNTVSMHDLTIVAAHYGLRAPVAWEGPAPVTDAPDGAFGAAASTLYTGVYLPALGG